jgi:hypothetical protein
MLHKFIHTKVNISHIISKCGQSELEYVLFQATVTPDERNSV